jgi:DNA polymerase-3 subunit delta
MAALKVEDFLARIANGKTVPAIVLHGPDTYLRDVCREKLAAAYLPEGTRDWALARFSAVDTNWDAVFERAQTLPMLAPRQLVFIEEVEVWQELEDDAMEALAAYLEDPAPFTVLVFEAAALDQRRKLFKTLSEKGLIVTLSVDPENAALLVAGMAREFGAELDAEAAKFLSDILDGELARIRVELEKLCVYAVGRRITTDDVEALVVSAKKYTVWQLADILATGRRGDALTFLESVLREGEQPPMIVGALVWMYRKLLEASELPADSPDWQAARSLIMRKEQAALALERAHQIPRKQLLDGLTALSEADNRLKSGKVDERVVLEFLVHRLVTAPAEASSATQ